MVLLEHIDTAIARTEAAAFDAGRWDDALRAVATATGSRLGQLIAISENDGVLSSHLPDADPEYMRAWVEHRCDDPAVNSRIRIGGAAKPMRSLDENAFTTEADKRRTPVYGKLIGQADIPFACVANLLREPDLMVGLAVLRGRDQGNIRAEQRRAFDLLAWHVRQAVRHALVMGLRTAARGLDALPAPAFVCDGTGRVAAVNAAAGSCWPAAA